MSVFKCKMCGGTLEINENQSTAVCEYCGTNQTLPKLDDDKRANMYDRANHFRRNNEYDKAASMYEQILSDDKTDAEAYWSILLCRYGVEYVEEPSGKNRVPTVNRAQFTSIYDDDNYKSAIEYADAYQKTIYESEAGAINEIQKGILAISQNEEPFDVFICYKESDSSGRRTPDSVLANDLYHQLTGEGYKVFFSRITLEDKLGTAYEPYIFAALNSAKVMVVLGTKPEYFNSVWVKNEWSRYLALVKNSGGKKILIPAYKDMDPYDLPEEFSHLQAQDMSKLGFMQDLIRGINKILGTDLPKPKPTVSAKAAEISNLPNPDAAYSPQTAPLLERAFMYLEDGKWDSADEYCEKVLDMEPKNAKAYLGKLMAELGCRAKADIKNCSNTFYNNDNYKKICRFGTEELKTELSGYLEFISERSKSEKLEKTYRDALYHFNNAKSEGGFKKAADEFGTISGYRDADAQRQKALSNAESARKDAIYDAACEKQESDEISEIENAIDEFKTIPGWRDSKKRIKDCRKRVDELKAEKEEYEKLREEQRLKDAKNQKIAKIVLLSAFAFIILIILYFTVISGWISDYKSGKVCDDMYAKIKNPQVGDTVKFGVFEQDNNNSNGKEAIEWIVLDKKDDKILVISKYCLDSNAYNDVYSGDTTWAECSLREWLNNSFYNNAFYGDSAEYIVESRISTPDNEIYGKDGGADTQDRIFLLSVEEARKYFEYGEDLSAIGTPYANSQDLLISDDGNASWWLRSPGASRSETIFVRDDGEIPNDGAGSSIRVFGVRPAMWIAVG